jgi:hypothetical protein
MASSSSMVQKAPPWARRAGITYRNLDHWVRRGWLHPEHVGRGPGSRRHWPTHEQQVAALMARCVNIGMTPALAARVARAAVGAVADGFALVVLADDMSLHVRIDELTSAA